MTPKRYFTSEVNSTMEKVKHMMEENSNSPKIEIGSISEAGKAIEKAFEGKLPESFVEKEIRRKNEALLDKIYSFSQHRKMFAINKRQDARRYKDLNDAEYYSGKASSYNEIEAFLENLVKELGYANFKRT